MRGSLDFARDDSVVIRDDGEVIRITGAVIRIDETEATLRFGLCFYPLSPFVG